MTDRLEQLLDSLLYEGYALYPYTPSATKNATPTPFGIVYPPAYAATLPSTFDHLELRCGLRASADDVVRAEVRFLVAGGERHRAAERRVELAGVMVGAIARGAPVARQEQVVSGQAGEPLTVALRLSAREMDNRSFELSLRVENRTAAPRDVDRRRALGRSLISAHPILRVSGGQFISPLDGPPGSVNTFPVLAGSGDDAIVGAAIILPDHPQIAPESRGDLFDSTEIEEALLLHLHALSDAEREEIAQQDPAVRQMIARASAATAEEIISLHGRVTLRDPMTTEPPKEPPGLIDPRSGERQAEVAGVTFLRGSKVLLRPGPDADLHARMLSGRIATIERIFTDYDGKVHLGVTIDGDPGQDLMRDTGRYLFFFAPEVEVLES